jgi:hypothetical protein
MNLALFGGLKQRPFPPGWTKETVVSILGGNEAGRVSHGVLPSATCGRGSSSNDPRLGDSNSLISWLIARSGLAVESIQPPSGRRAPSWRGHHRRATRRGTASLDASHIRRRNRPMIADRWIPQ